MYDVYYEGEIYYALCQGHERQRIIITIIVIALKRKTKHLTNLKARIYSYIILGLNNLTNRPRLVVRLGVMQKKYKRLYCLKCLENFSFLIRLNVT